MKHPNRRDFLKGIVAFAASAAIPRLASASDSLSYDFDDWQTHFLCKLARDIIKTGKPISEDSEGRKFLQRYCGSDTTLAVMVDDRGQAGWSKGDRLYPIIGVDGEERLVYGRKIYLEDPFIQDPDKFAKTSRIAYPTYMEKGSHIEIAPSILQNRANDLLKRMGGWTEGDFLYHVSNKSDDLVSVMNILFEDKDTFRDFRYDLH